MSALFWVISRVAVKPGEDPSSDPIGKGDEDTMLVCLCKLPLEDELDDCMAELSTAVCEDVCWRRDAKLVHVCICKVIRKLQKHSIRLNDTVRASQTTLPWEDMRGDMLGTLMV